MTGESLSEEHQNVDFQIAVAVLVVDGQIGHGWEQNWKTNLKLNERKSNIHQK